MIGVGLLATIVLASYGLVHYPGLRSDGDAAIVAIAFPTLLVLYGTVTLALSRGTRVWEVTARRHGLTGGVVIGTAWLLVLSPTSVLKQWVLVPLIDRAVRPRCIAVLAARAGGVVTAGTRSALWSGIVGGLLVFTVSMTATYVSDGRPYDPQLLRDLPHSGAPDLATLAVSDALADALTLLILIPLTALALGSLGARLARTADPTATSAPPRPAPPT